MHLIETRFFTFLSNNYLLLHIPKDLRLFALLLVVQDAAAVEQIFELCPNPRVALNSLHRTASAVHLRRNYKTRLRVCNFDFLRNSSKMNILS